MCGGCGNHSQKEKEMHSVHVAEDLFDRSRFPLKHADNNKSSSPPLEAISSNLKNFMLFTLIIHPFVCVFFLFCFLLHMFHSFRLEREENVLPQFCSSVRYSTQSHSKMVKCCRVFSKYLLIAASCVAIRCLFLSHLELNGIIWNFGTVLTHFCVKINDCMVKIMAVQSMPG